MVEFILEIPIKRRITCISELFIQEPKIELSFTTCDFEFAAWGDPVYKGDFRERFDECISPEFIVNNLYGHYYFLHLNKKSGDLLMGNSLFSILPVYYHTGKENITISENAITLGGFIKSKKICKRFILETVLFNYPLFNNSVFQGINLLPSNSHLSFSGGTLRILKHNSIENLFDKNPVPWLRSIGPMSDKFIETIEKYLPDKHYSSSLTGGFDGRTLVSAGLYYKKRFSTFSFGTEKSKDVKIAEILSIRGDLHFDRIELGKDYVTQSSLKCGMEFIKNSSGTATFSRAHYLHASKQLASVTDTIVTGNFGSEIFRAVHIAGVVISGNLFTLFNSNSPDKAFKLVEASHEFRSLNKVTFSEDWESLKECILKLPCFSKQYSDLTKNQMFYVFVFEELFRKYFGAEMINQFRYLKNRTPFLDIDFLKAIFKTELAGIHSDFFENNPFKRYKGQVLYAQIIKKTFPAFGAMFTDKGYRPDDLINFLGKISIAKGYFKKALIKPSLDFDPNGVGSAWEENCNYWNSVPVLLEYFNNYDSSSIKKEILFKILSLSYLIHEISK